MKLAVLGATGNTGLCLVRQAVEAGHDVVAVMRNTAKFTFQHEKVQVKECDIFSEDLLSDALKGCDAVVSSLGARTYKTNLYSESIKVVTAAMKKAEISRIIAVTSWCTTDNPNDRGPFILEWILKPTILKRALADMALMEDYLRDSCPDINYTIVRPSELQDKSISDKPFKVEVERLHVPGGSRCIARADLARFMLTCLGTTEYDRKMVAVAV